MSATLDQLKPKLLAIPATDIDESDIPIAIAFHEAADLAELVRQKALLTL